MHNQSNSRDLVSVRRKQGNYKRRATPLTILFVQYVSLAILAPSGGEAEYLSDRPRSNRVTVFQFTGAFILSVSEMENRKESNIATGNI